MTPFGKKVKIAMIQQGISGKELAKSLNLSSATICDLIYGRNTSEETKKKVKEQLGMDRGTRTRKTTTK